jgi:serine/threonine-protein kinase
MSSPGEIDAPDDGGAGRLGQVISGRYRIERLLGEGGMGAVYLAEHTAMRKRVALKLLHKEMSDNQEVLARFEQEGFAAARVEHPNVASATDFGRAEDGSLYLVLEYVEGTSLRDAIAGGRIAPARALHVARQIAHALDRAHAAGIVHRDLKPENVMLVQKGDDPDFVKVLDFGIAKVTAAAMPEGSSQPLTRLGTILGTPEYMAPEQALAEAVTPASDLYALGIILYEMLAGAHPFAPPDRAAMLSFHIVAPVPPMRERAPECDCPAPVEAVVRKLLEKDKNARYPSARALLDALDASAAESGLEVRGSAVSLPKGGLAQLAPPSDPSWSAKDSFAKTSYGGPAPNLETPAPARTTLTDTIRKMPKGTLVALAAALPIGFLLVVVAFVVASRTSPAARAEGGAGISLGSAASLIADDTAPPARVTEAAAKGADALAALASEYPSDQSLARRVALAYGAEGRGPEALLAVRALAEKDQAAAEQPEILKLVETAAVSQQQATVDEAFTLLEGPLGAGGFDVLVELSKKGPRATRARAAKSMADPSVRAHASPAASIFLDMKAAKGCAKKKALLGRAKESGDARMLATLKRMKRRGGCGFFRRSDCYGCMRKDDDLDDAFTAVAARADGGAESPDDD